MEKLMKKLYVKNIFVIAAAVVLSVILSVTTKNYSNMIFGLLIAVYFVYNILEVQKKYKNNEFISLTAQCIDVDKKKIAINKNIQSEYRFLTVLDGQEGFIYIKGYDRQFKIGECYELCFTKKENKEYNESNLLVYNTVPFSDPEKQKDK